LEYPAFLNAGFNSSGSRNKYIADVIAATSEQMNLMNESIS
jgi:hypothetical protein